MVAGGNSCQRCDAAGQVLAIHQDIGHDVVVLDAPHPSGATQTGQHLVDDHQPVVPVTHFANALQESSRRDPIAALGKSGLNKDPGDIVTSGNTGRDVIVEVPQTVLRILRFAQVGRQPVTVRVGGLDDAAAPALQVGSFFAFKSAQDLCSQPIAVKGRAEGNNVAPLRVRERQVNRCLGGFRARDFVVRSWQRFRRHDVGEAFRQVVTEGMVIMEAEAPVGGFDGFDNFRVTVAERIGRPTILEVDIAITVQIPDEVAFGPVNDDLPNRAKAAPARTFHLRVESQAVLEQWNTAF